MKTKTTIIASTILVLSSISATTWAKPDTFKVAIIEGSVGSKEIIKGELHQSLTKMKQNSDTLIEQYEQSMGLCAAHIKLSAFIKAEKNCSSAVESAIQLKSSDEKFIALAYNNRAIARALNDDNLGALDDFTSAILINQSSLINNNLSHFKKRYLVTLTAQTTGNTTSVTH